MIATGIAPFQLAATEPAPPPAIAPRKCTVTLLIPTLNEVEGMKVIMPLVEREWVDQILILDGGSTDGTIEYARAQGYEVHVQKEPGIRQGYMEVLPKVRGDVILTFSPDGNSIPELLPRLIAKIDEGYDMVIASRLSSASEERGRRLGDGVWKLALHADREPVAWRAVHGCDGDLPRVSHAAHPRTRTRSGPAGTAHQKSSSAAGSAGSRCFRCGRRGGS